jgi:hypothetical protein
MQDGDYGSLKLYEIFAYVEWYYYCNTKRSESNNFKLIFTIFAKLIAKIL